MPTPDERGQLQARIESGVILYRVFWRATAHNPPEEVDFYSYAQLGKPLMRDNARGRRLAAGISVFDSLARARQVAQERNLGDYVAELHVLDDGSVEMEPGKRGHWTLWAEPAVLLRCAASVVPVAASDE